MRHAYPVRSRWFSDSNHSSCMLSLHPCPYANSISRQPSGADFASPARLFPSFALRSEQLEPSLLDRLDKLHVLSECFEPQQWLDGKKNIWRSLLAPFSWFDKAEGFLPLCHDSDCWQRLSFAAVQNFDLVSTHPSQLGRRWVRRTSTTHEGWVCERHRTPRSCANEPNRSS